MFQGRRVSCPDTSNGPSGRSTLSYTADVTQADTSSRRGGGRGRGRGRGRGGRGDGGACGTSRPVKLGFKALTDVEKKTPDEIVLDLTSSRCFPATESLLMAQTSMSPDMIVLIVSVLSRACDCDSREFLFKLLNLLPKSTFFTIHLAPHLNRLAANSTSSSETATFLRNLIKILNELLRKFPNSYADLPVSELFCSVTLLSQSGDLTDQDLLAEVNEMMSLRKQKAEELKKKEEEKQCRRVPRRDAAANDEETPPDDFRQLSVVPTQEDILTAEKPFLRRNKVDGRYNDAEHYLDVQFRLLREDFIRPLREGIAQLLERIGTAKIGALQDIRVYKDVHLLYPVCTSNGLTYKIKFDNAKLKHVRWENSKRLIFGSLVCLSKDKFESFVFATIANRVLKELKEGKVDVQFINLSDNMTLESGDVYQMVESTVYFEAYRHVLEGLKEADTQTLPLQKYIVECKKEVEPPAYMRNRFRERMTFDLTPIMRKETERGLSSWDSLREMRLRLAGLSVSKKSADNVPILNLASWPSAEELQLDNSQFKALQMALTNEFSVIQGPPGTGKTYIGLKIAKVLLHNKVKWDSGGELLEEEAVPRLLQRHARDAAHRPILVVCYTNHALDQFLEGIHAFHPEGIVRVGGRSQSETMKACSLSELKHQMHQNKAAPLEVRRAFYDAHMELDDITRNMQSATQDLQNCMENLLHEDELQRSASSMTRLHYNSLKEPYGGTVQKKGSVILHWLQLSVDSGISSHGGFVQPVAIFPFNHLLNGCELISRARLATLAQCSWASGIDGSQGGSIMLHGRPDSFIEISNHPGSDLDTRHSITILLHVYPIGNRGPILSFHEEGLGVQIWQEGVFDGKGILTARFVWRDHAQPPALTQAVLTINAWNFIGASYDYESGVAYLWHNGNNVEAKYIGRKMELATQFSIRMGALATTGLQFCFRGGISQLHIYAEALGMEDVRGVGGIVNKAEDGMQNGEEEEEEEEEDESENPDVLYEANVIRDQRLLDVDDVRVFGFGKSAVRRGKLKVLNPFGFDGRGQDGWQVQNVAGYKKKLKRTIIQELSRKDVMPENRAALVTNVWRLNLKDRWRLYRRWLTDTCQSYRRTIAKFQGRFEEGARRLKEVKNMEDFEVLKNADVVGMTTTGAAKYRKLLQKVRPRITIVEEAAEVLEAHIITALSPGCQHLILIGDHQQLRPNPTVYKLAKDYKLDISLFERMVNNGMPFARLRLQHRMRPEIAQTLEHIYSNPKLENHASVLNFENIKGVAHNIFFLDHSEVENYIDEGKSRSNLHEAKFLSALCRYFILQGYKREQITILTAYTGQLIQLKREMPKDFFQGVRVCAVDNFQGEENDIILLSLVRSNEEGKIGFLQTENRVCVALSRAKKGFYCIGNMSLLEEKNALWEKIVSDLRKQGKIGEALTLTCQNHPGKVIQASRAEDFKKAPEGGCTEPCSTRLKCGHVCEMVCHPTDPEHVEYKCNKPCTKTLCSLNHICPKWCYQDCGPCMELVEKTIPSCGHIQKVSCSVAASEEKCMSPCKKTLSCGHPCSNRCNEECTEKCVVSVKKSWSCGHENEVECHVNPIFIPCRATCGVPLKCEHLCGGDCSSCLRGRVHVPCKSKCDRTLFCGHSCSESCTRNCPPCQNVCENYCKHSKCKKKCGEVCQPCNEKCEWRCPHKKCTRLCGEMCNRTRCNEPCSKQLPCKHFCIGLCGEKCPEKCRECNKDEVTEIFFGTEDDPKARFVELEDCGHLFEVEMMDQWMDQAVAKEDGQAVGVQLKRCPRCNTPVRTSLRYGNVIKDILASFEKIKRKIFINERKRVEVAKRLQLEVKKITTFPNETEKISLTLERDNLTNEQVNVLENQINFLKFLQELRIKVSREMQSSTDSIEITINLNKEVDDLKTRIMKPRLRFSEQELEEIDEEMKRILLLIDFKLLKMHLDTKCVKLSDIDSLTLDYVRVALESEKPIDPTTREHYMARLKRLRKLSGLQVFYHEVTRREKDMIVKAMGLQQGHWFKCSKGHIYCITECGGAMQEGDCPECGTKIGGQNHRLRDDNQLASEMDGAQHPAWSNMTDLRNFDFGDLR